VFFSSNEPKYFQKRTVATLLSAQNGKHQKNMSNAGAHLFIKFIMKNTPIDGDLQHPSSTNILHW
jgi:hypothetical protein